MKNGESQHGVTIHKIHGGIDDGDVLGQVTYPIYPEIEEVEDVYNKALEYGWVLFKDVISKIEYTTKNAKAQAGTLSYYSNKQNKLLKEREGFRRK